MIDEKEFDYENYIQEQLRRIDDLDERRFAKELLVESLGRMFAWTEEKYAALERRVRNELDVSLKSFDVYTIIINKEDYDPINNFWFPAWDADIQKNVEKTRETVYLEADEKICKEFLELKTLTGIDRETGETILFRIEKSRKYQQCIQNLYALFTENHVPWRTVHMGYIERFFDLVPLTDQAEPADIEWVCQDSKWEILIRRKMILFWNIQKISVRSREYRIPCIDDVFYEHIFYLPEEKSGEDGYLVETGEDILSIRYEQNKVILKTKQETLGDVCTYRLHQREPEQSAGYQYPVLSNRSKDNLSARYTRKTGNFIQTPLELYRKVEEMAGEYGVKVIGFEIADRAEENFLSGDMNSFAGVRLFGNDNRKILLIKIRGTEQDKNDYLFESQIRYILSQLQMEFLEYRCMGVVV